MKYKPQLITNDPIPENCPFPRFSSPKRHGICVIFKDDEELILGRSLKPIKNVQFQGFFKEVLQYCKDNNVLIQGEAHIKGAISDDMIRFTNTIDLNDLSKAKLKDLDDKIESGALNFPKEFYLSFPDSMKIYVFDCLKKTDIGYDIEKKYYERYKDAKKICDLFPNLLEIIPQTIVNSEEEAIQKYNEYMGEGFEGAVERFDKPYKMNRSTPKEFLIYKRLPENTFDGKITAVNQATVVDPNAEKTINELGYSVTDKKKDSRILIEKAKDFQVEMIPEGKTEPISFGVGLKGFDDEARREVWNNPEKYIGRWIEFECKAYEGIGCPKSAQFIRFRDDKE